LALLGAFGGMLARLGWIFEAAFGELGDEPA